MIPILIVISLKKAYGLRCPERVSQEFCPPFEGDFDGLELPSCSALGA